MRISTLIQNIKTPPHESGVGYMTRADGRTMRLLPFVILINLVWLFVWAVLAGQSFMDVILPTLISVPIYVYLHLCVYFYGGTNNVRLWYVAGVFALGFALAPWNFSSLGYLIFGFFMIVYLIPMKVSSAVIALSIAAFMLEIKLLGASGSTLVSVLVPAVTLAVIAVF